MLCVMLMQLVLSYELLHVHIQLVNPSTRCAHSLRYDYTDRHHKWRR